LNAARGFEHALGPVVIVGFNDHDGEPVLASFFRDAVRIIDVQLNAEQARQLGG
jgi:hypothetical protein